MGLNLREHSTRNKVTLSETVGRTGNEPPENQEAYFQGSFYDEGSNPVSETLGLDF